MVVRAFERPRAPGGGICGTSGRFSKHRSRSRSSTDDATNLDCQRRVRDDGAGYLDPTWYYFGSAR